MAADITPTIRAAHAAGWSFHLRRIPRGVIVTATHPDHDRQRYTVDIVTAQRIAWAADTHIETGVRHARLTLADIIA